MMTDNSTTLTFAAYALALPPKSTDGIMAEV